MCEANEKLLVRVSYLSLYLDSNAKDERRGNISQKEYGNLLAWIKRMNVMKGRERHVAKTDTSSVSIAGMLVSQTGAQRGNACIRSLSTYVASGPSKNFKEDEFIAPQPCCDIQQIFEHNPVQDCDDRQSRSRIDGDRA